MGIKKIKTNGDYIGKRLLVVDDEAEMQRVFRKVLKRPGFEVDTVSSAAQALELVRKRKYDLLLIDIRMTSMDGLELLVKLHDMTPETRAIIITGSPSIYTARRSRALGAYDYLTKPISIDELNDAVEKALSSPVNG